MSILLFHFLPFETDPILVGRLTQLQLLSIGEHGAGRRAHLQDLLLHVRSTVVQLVTVDGSACQHGSAHLQSKAEYGLCACCFVFLHSKEKYENLLRFFYSD